MDERIAGLQAQVSQMMERVAEDRGDYQSILRRLEELESSDRRQNEMNIALQRQTDTIDALHEKMDALADQMNSVSGRVSEIEKEPGERWKKISFEIIKYIVLAAVGAAIGYLSK